MPNEASHYKGLSIRLDETLTAKARADAMFSQAKSAGKGSSHEFHDVAVYNVELKTINVKWNETKVSRLRAQIDDGEVTLTPLKSP